MSSEESMVMRWEKVQQQNGNGGKRWGHTCNSIKGGKFVYLFGGYGEDQHAHTNQVHVFDTVNMMWSELVVKGTPPTPRDSHSCTTVDDNLFVFGGTDGKNPLNDLHLLNTSSNTWVSPSLRGDGPEAREGHSAALIGKRLFIFGGCAKVENSEIYYDDLYILNIETFSWKRVVPSGTPPSKRVSHTCSSWKEKIIIIGGEDSNNYYLSDVHILDTDSLAWCKLDTTGQLPPRGGHTTVSYGKNLFVFGGFSDDQNLYDDVHVLDLEKNSWKKVVAVGEGPSSRFSVAGQCLDPQMAGVLVFIGGCNKNLEALNDMYFMHTGLSREVDRDERRNEKLSLRKLLKLKCQEHAVSPASRFEHDTTVYQATPISSYKPPGRHNIYSSKYNDPLGKRTFQAKLTKSTPDTSIYDIETIIDGKLLRGVVFADRPSLASTITGNSDRTTSDGVNVSGNPNSAADSEMSVDRCDFNLVDVRDEEAGEAQREVGALEIKPQEVAFEEEFCAFEIKPQEAAFKKEVGALEIKTQEAAFKGEVSAMVINNPEAVPQVDVAAGGIKNPASPESLVHAEVFDTLDIETVMESQTDAGDNVPSPSFFDVEIREDAAYTENQNAPLK